MLYEQQQTVAGLRVQLGGQKKCGNAIDDRKTVIYFERFAKFKIVGCVDFSSTARIIAL
jgi:hypothetical protein